jgi:spermidine synthase
MILAKQGTIEVVSNNGIRELNVDGFCQGRMYESTGRPASIYMYEMMGRANLIDRCLCIGGGACLIPTDLSRSNTQCDVIEMNPYVINIAEEYFRLNCSKHKVYYLDAKDFKPQEQYSTIFIDAFNGHYQDKYLYSETFKNHIKNWLLPNGVIVYNTLVNFEGKLKNVVTVTNGYDSKP